MSVMWCGACVLVYLLNARFEQFESFDPCVEQLA